MPCYHPLHAWRVKSGCDPTTGNWPITFNMRDGYIDKPVTIPCGQCIGCRLEKSRIWALRCVHEASFYNDNCFITLTFDNKHLADDGSLHKRDFVLFMKRLRKKYGNGIRFFHCGEYGGQNGRPHHHAILFNFKFPDEYIWERKNGSILRRSDSLEELWPYGFSAIGDVTFESCAYVARYILKKQTGKDAKDFYGDKTPEYVTMSRKPGIGHEWIEKYMDDVYPKDRIVFQRFQPNKGFNFGTFYELNTPAYYDKVLKEADPDMYNRIKARRTYDNDGVDYLSSKQLGDAEENKIRQTETLFRHFEEDFI